MHFAKASSQPSHLLCLMSGAEVLTLADLHHDLCDLPRLAIRSGFLLTSLQFCGFQFGRLVSAKSRSKLTDRTFLTVCWPWLTALSYLSVPWSHGIVVKLLLLPKSDLVRHERKQNLWRTLGSTRAYPHVQRAKPLGLNVPGSYPPTRQCINYKPSDYIGLLIF